MIVRAEYANHRCSSTGGVVAELTGESIIKDIKKNKFRALLEKGGILVQ